MLLPFGKGDSQVLEINLRIGECVAKRLRSTLHCKVTEHHCSGSHSRPHATQLLDGAHQYSTGGDRP